MVKSQFNYCPLVWMFRSRQSNNLINKIHERSVRPLSLSLSLSLSAFQSNEYNIRNFQVLLTDFRRTVNYGTETFTCRAPPLWAKLPSEHKLAASLEEFKVKV